VLTLEVPDLASRLAQKRAELREAEARLRLLRAGPRPEEVAEQGRRVERARAWRDLAGEDLRRAGRALEEELARLDKQVTQCRAELDAAQDAHSRSKDLRGRNALAAEQYYETERRFRVSQAQLEQARAERRARQAKGAPEAEAELARREKELADAQGALALLQAGTRPEELEAEAARLARLQEEARYLEQLQGRVLVHSPVSGVVITPRLKERAGQYVREGELLCTVEEPSRLEAEVTLAEQDVPRVRAGQEVGLKARALPFETLPARVDRVAPAAGRGDVTGVVTVYCGLGGVPGELRPGMTGHARVYTGRRSLAAIGLDRALRYLRTEFWW
jgi:multidrug resistance efflux pump